MYISKKARVTMKAILLMVEETDKQAWRERAVEEGRTLSGWIRYHLNNVPQNPDNAIWVQSGKEAADNRKARQSWRIDVKTHGDYTCYRCAIKMSKYTAKAHHVKPVKEGGRDIL